MGIGAFVDDYREKLVEDSTKAWIDAPSTWDKGNAEEQWEIIKQSAKDAGMSVLDWFSEVAFKGSQNPQGMAQEAPIAGTASIPVVTPAAFMNCLRDSSTAFLLKSGANV